MGAENIQPALPPSVPIARVPTEQIVLELRNRLARERHAAEVAAAEAARRSRHAVFGSAPMGRSNVSNMPADLVTSLSSDLSGAGPADHHELNGTVIIEEDEDLDDAFDKSAASAVSKQRRSV